MSRRLLIGLVVICALVPAVAHADEPPWSRGVSAERKAAAQKLLEQGNALFLANKHKEALEKYTAATEQWDHPAIRFNMVRAQIALDRPLDAADNLEKALAYGAKPLEDQVYQEALNYQRLLAGQIAYLEVSCSQTNVSIKLDGDLLLACPGTTKTRRRPGKHVLVGTGPELDTATHDLALNAGATEKVTMHLDTPHFATGPRWARWKPWAVVGTGALLVGTGVVFNMLARAHADDVDRTSAFACPDGCTDEEYAAIGLDDVEAKVRRENVISISALSAGGAAILIGGVLAALNRRTIERVEVRSTTGGASVMLGGSF